MKDDLVKRARIMAERLQLEGLTSSTAALVGAMAVRIEADAATIDRLVRAHERHLIARAETRQRIETLETRLAKLAEAAKNARNYFHGGADTPFKVAAALDAALSEIGGGA